MRIFVFMWQKMGAKIPANVKGLFLRIGVVLSILTCTRLLFFFYNYDSFSEVVWTDWLSGIWFDLVTISLLLMPFILKNGQQLICLPLFLLAMISVNY